MKYNQLGSTDMKVSSYALGASGFSSFFGEADEAECIQVVHEAIKAGVNYIDTAPWYGHGTSETTLGKAFTDIPRSSFYIATKVGRYKPQWDEMFDFSYERTIKSVDESLNRLGLEYVDIVQVHDMEFAPNLEIIIKETLPALKKCQEAGKLRYIGITGYPLEQFRTVIERSPVKINTVLSYCRNMLSDISLQDYIPYLQSKGIGVIDASSVGMGLFTERGPPDWHPAPKMVKIAAKNAANYCKEQNVDISSLAIHYALGLGGPATTLTGTKTLTKLQNNIKLYNSGLNAHEKEVLQYIKEKYFDFLTIKHWEGFDVIKYWEKIEEGKK